MTKPREQAEQRRSVVPDSSGLFVVDEQNAHQLSHWRPRAGGQALRSVLAHQDPERAAGSRNQVFRIGTQGLPVPDQPMVASTSTGWSIAPVGPVTKAVGMHLSHGGDDSRRPAYS